MHLTIALEVDVPDLATAQNYVNQLRSWLASNPDVAGRAFLTNDLTDELETE